jgi:hypothetical protein
VNRYTRDWDVEGPAPGGNFNKSAFTYQPNPNPLPAIIPIPRGVWMVDGNLAFGTSTPPTSLQPPVTVLSTGTVRVDNNSKVFLRPVTRDVSLLAGRDLFLGGGTMLLTCGEPTPTLTGCPSAAIMVYEQVSLGANSHLQGQLVVESGGKCSEDVEGKAVSNGGNATISVPAMPPIYSPGGAVVLSWGESSL